MSRVCELTGKSIQVGHRVSHSNIKTKHRFLPNLKAVTLESESLGQRVRLRVSTRALSSVDLHGGLDNFLLRQRDDELSIKARRLKRQVAKKRAGAEAAA